MTVTGFVQLQNRIEDIKDDLADEVNDAVEERLEATERRAKREMIEKDAIASPAGGMFNSFVQTSVVKGTSWSKVTRHTLTNVSPHAAYQEFGTGDYFYAGAGGWGFNQPPNPYKAPSLSLRLVAAIEFWIVKKPGFRRDPSAPGRGAAFPIAQSISKRTVNDPAIGTPPQPFMRPAWHVEKRTLELDLRHAVGKVVNRYS